MGIIFAGIFVAFLPSLAISAAFFYWAIKSGLLPTVSDARYLDKAIKAVKQDYQSAKKGKKGQRRSEDGMIWYDSHHQGNGNFLFRKWMAFGAGFYGLMALFTYAVIEYQEIVDFFSNFTSIQDFINRIGIGMLIGFIIESIINFLLALVWPLTWVIELSFPRAVIYLVEAYIGYRVGRSWAFSALQKTPEKDGQAKDEGTTDEGTTDQKATDQKALGLIKKSASPDPKDVPDQDENQTR